MTQKRNPAEAAVLKAFEDRYPSVLIRVARWGREGAVTKEQVLEVTGELLCAELESRLRLSVDQLAVLLKEFLATKDAPS